MSHKPVNIIPNTPVQSWTLELYFWSGESALEPQGQGHSGEVGTGSQARPAQAGLTAAAELAREAPHRSHRSTAFTDRCFLPKSSAETTVCQPPRTHTGKYVRDPQEHLQAKREAGIREDGLTQNSNFKHYPAWHV